MEIRIKSFNGVLPDYLKVDKQYSVISGYVVDGDYFVTVEGGMAVPVNTSLKGCRHLNGGSWEVVND